MNTDHVQKTSTVAFSRPPHAYSPKTAPTEISYTCRLLVWLYVKNPAFLIMYVIKYTGFSFSIREPRHRIPAFLWCVCLFFMTSLLHLGQSLQPCRVQLSRLTVLLFLSPFLLAGRCWGALDSVWLTRPSA